MGLTSLWSNITGPRVKEIAPQQQCSWLEKNRPQTSASSRAAKKLPHLNLKPSSDRESRPATSHDGQKKKRSLSISRPRLIEERKASGLLGGHDVPEVPALPSTLSPRSKGQSDELARPGTAITTNGSVSTTERFELAGHGLPSPDFHSPLPSPRSPTYPTSPESFASLAFREDTHAENGGGLRKRSNSSASGKPKNKRASWFVSSKKKTEAELPPPLPPPSIPPPPPPVVQPLVAELPDTRPPLDRMQSYDSQPETPLSPATKNSLDGDSILNAFPSVPVPIPARDSSRTPEAIQRNSAIIQEGTQSNTESEYPEKRFSPPPPSTTTKARPIVVPTQTIDGLLAPEISKDKEVLLKHDSKQLPPLPPPSPTTPTAPSQETAETVKHSSLSFSEELQQEYDRLMDLMGEQPNPRAVISVVGEFDHNTQTFQGPQKFLNDEALSQLEFGLLK